MHPDEECSVATALDIPRVVWHGTRGVMAWGMDGKRDRIVYQNGK
jgi:hypothetical protein